MRFSCVPKPCHWRREHIARQLDTAAPALAVPALLSIASLSPTYTLLVFLASPGLLYYLHRNFLRFLPRSRFILAWAFSSAACLLLVFELCVVPLLEILPEENLVFFALLVAGFLCGYMTRVRAEQLTEEQEDGELAGNSENVCNACGKCTPLRAVHCRLCQTCVPDRQYHCLWLDCCIGSMNLRWYLYCLFCTAAALIYGSNLSMTTVCHPYAFFWTILLPDDCTDVYFMFETALAFVASIYSLIIGAILMGNWAHHLWKIFKKSYWSGNPRNQNDDQMKKLLLRAA